MSCSVHSPWMQPSFVHWGGTMRRAPPKSYPHYTTCCLSSKKRNTVMERIAPACAFHWNVGVEGRSLLLQHEHRYANAYRPQFTFFANLTQLPAFCKNIE